MLHVLKSNSKHCREDTIYMVKHDNGTTMLESEWFSSAQTVRLVNIDGKMNRAKHRQILDEETLKDLRRSQTLNRTATLKIKPKFQWNNLYQSIFICENGPAKAQT